LARSRLSLILTLAALLALGASLLSSALASHTGNGGPPYFPGRDVAVDMETTVSSIDSGYVLETNGTVHAFGGAPAVVVQPSIGSSRARALEIWYSDGGYSGYVLTGNGALHRWATASAPLPPEIILRPSWDFDIARDFEFTYFGNGYTAGYVLSGYGSLHRFASAGAVVPKDIDEGPWWPDWDIARDLEVAQYAGDPGNARGWILSGWGSIHPWSTVDLANPSGVSDYSYWEGWDIARDLEILGDPTPFGWTLSGWGSLHDFGSATPVTDGPFFEGWDIARDHEQAFCASHLVMDGWGGRHPGHADPC
jgi:hypothetical protein